MRIFYTLVGFVVAFSLPRVAWSDAVESVAIGRDRLLFTNQHLVTPRYRRLEMASRWGEERHVPAGRPFRLGVEVCDVKPGNAAYRLVHMDGVYDALNYGNVEYFLDKIQAVRDFEEVLSRVNNVRREDWLTPEELPLLYTMVGAAPAEFRFAVVGREIEPDLLKKGIFHRGGVWLAAFVVQEGASVVEFKVAIDGKNRVAYHRRVLVDGPQPPVSGAGLFTPLPRAREEAFAVAYPFLRDAIESCKTGAKK
jgi:hypothetical protein